MSVSTKQIYSQVPKSLACEKYLASIQPSSGNTFVPGDQIEFIIPTRKLEFLNSVNTTLRFKVTPTSTAGDPRFDNNATTVIDRVEVYHGSNLLEQLGGNGVLHTTMLEAQTYEWNTPVTNVVAGQPGLSAPPISYGFATDVKRGGLSFAAAGTYIEISLLSSVVGLLANPNKYLPLCKMQAGPLRVVITVKDAVSGSTNTSRIATFSDVSLNCEFVKVGEEAMEVIDKANEAIYGSRDVVQLNIKQWEDYIYPLANGLVAGTAVSSLVDARYSSVCGIVFSFLNNGLSYKLSSRSNPYSSLQLRVGSNYYPRAPIRAGASNQVESFMISQRYLGTLNDINSFGSITKEEYENNTGSLTGGYYLMIDLETYDKENLLYDGINTLNDNIFVDGVLRYNMTTTMLCHAHVQFDAILTCEKGVMTRSL
jgi:hypothetical protein